MSTIEGTTITPNVAQELKGLTITISGRGSISVHPDMGDIQKFIKKKRMKLGLSK